MFPPSTPPHVKKVNLGTSTKEKKWPGWLKTTLCWLFILCGLGMIAAIIVHNPREPRLVCKNTPVGSASLTTFGTCESE